jgi:uncharacterized protein (DUF433 family)
LTIEPEPALLVLDADGVARIGATRVTLDTLVAAFEEGATAEEIVRQYPSLQLADVCSVIGYYLRGARVSRPIFAIGRPRGPQFGRKTSPASIQQACAPG